MKEKECEKCHKIFNCTHSAECWCAEFKISEKLGKYLAKNYKDCLCNECLKNYIENEENILL